MMLEQSIDAAQERHLGENNGTASKAQLISIGETVVGIAHSIKNVMGMIRGGEYMVESGLARQNWPRVREGWGMVKTGNGYVADLVRKMLALSRDTPPAYEEIRLCEILESLEAVLRPKADSRNVALRMTAVPSGLVAPIDVACIREALVNLIDNAIDACPEESGLVTVRAQTDGDATLVISVADNGPGVSTDVRPKIFTPFFTTKGSKGNGLGLPVVQKIVDEHQGSLRVSRQADGGAHFEIRLPRLRAGVSNGSESQKEVVVES